MIPLSTQSTPLLSNHDRKKTKWMPTLAYFVVAVLLVVCGVVWIVESQANTSNGHRGNKRLKSEVMGGWWATVEFGESDMFDVDQHRRTELIELDGSIVAMGVTKQIDENPDEWFFFSVDCNDGQLLASKKIVTPTLYSFDSILVSPTRLLPDLVRNDFIINAYQEDPTKRVIFGRLSKELELKWTRSFPSQNDGTVTMPSSLSMKHNNGLVISYGWNAPGHVEIVKFASNTPARGVQDVDWAYQMIYENAEDGATLILHEINQRGGGGNIVGAVHGYPKKGNDDSNGNDLMLFRIDQDGFLAWANYYRIEGLPADEWAMSIQDIDGGLRLFVTGQSEKDRFHLIVMASTGHVLSGLSYGRSVIMDSQIKFPHGNEVLAYDEDSHMIYSYSTYSSVAEGESVYGFISMIDTRSGEILDNVIIGGTAMFADLTPIILESSDFSKNMIDIALAYRTEERWIRVVRLVDVFNDDNAMTLCAYDMEITLQKGCFDDLMDIDLSRRDATDQFEANDAQIDVLGYSAEMEDLMYDSFTVMDSCVQDEIDTYIDELNAKLIHDSFFDDKSKFHQDARNNGLCGLKKKDLPKCTSTLCDDPDASPSDLCAAKFNSVNPGGCGGPFQQLQCRDCGDNVKCVRRCNDYNMDMGTNYDCSAECGAVAEAYKCFHGC